MGTQHKVKHIDFLSLERFLDDAVAEGWSVQSVAPSHASGEYLVILAKQVKDKSSKRVLTERGNS